MILFNNIRVIFFNVAKVENTSKRCSHVLGYAPLTFHGLFYEYMILFITSLINLSASYAWNTFAPHSHGGFASGGS